MTFSDETKKSTTKTSYTNKSLQFLKALKIACTLPGKRHRCALRTSGLKGKKERRKKEERINFSDS